MKSSRSRIDLHQRVKVRVPRDYPWKVLSSLTEDLRHCLSDEHISDITAIIRNRDVNRYMSLSATMGPQSMYPCGMSIARVRAQYQVSSLLKKFRFSTAASDRRNSALTKFRESEKHCMDFNRFGYDRITRLSDPFELRVFTYAQNFLQRLLGSVLPDSSKLRRWSRHGPGANLDTLNRQISQYFKYSEWPYSCTEAAQVYAVEAIKEDERWLGALEDSYRERNNIPKHAILNQQAFYTSLFKIVDGNRVTFVPKNGLTDRSIAIEPSINLYLQLGVDGYIRRRLLRWGVNLDSQERNQALAREGSLNWADPDCFVTLDLAAASDSISIGLCKALLPPQWYSYLMSIRSPYGELDGERFSYEKISSMGNGYTFALESAIFTAVVYAVMKATRGQFRRDQFAVYGDDIIVPKSIAPQVIDALNLFGFQLNKEKSFVDGPFRESCGADWFQGKPVRPVFLTETPSTVFGLWCDLNRIRRILYLRDLSWESKSCDLIQRWIPEMFSTFLGPLSDTDFD